MRLPFAAQSSENRMALFAQEMLKEYAEHCDEPQEEEGGGDLSHRLSPLLSTAKRAFLDFDPASPWNSSMFMFCSPVNGLI